MPLCFLERAADIIGACGGVQDVLAAMRAYPSNGELMATCCNALWSLTVNGELLNISCLDVL